MRHLSAGLCLCLLASPAVAVPSLSIGDAGPVLLDGRCEAGEWADAARHAVSDRISLLLQQDERFLYVCVLSPEESMNTLDVYLQAADRPGLVNLHASAQVGQRTRGEDGWPDYVWWNHEGWYSPAVPYIGIQRDGERVRPQFKPGIPREMQIEKSRFGAYPWRVMFVVGGERDEAGNWINRRFPESAGEDSTDGWLRLGD